MKKSFFLFVIIFCMAGFTFAEKAGTLTGFIMPGQIQVDEEQIYIVEGPTISIYSLDDLKFVKKFGRRGEGPREFMGEIRINVTADYLLVNSSQRVTFFTKNGGYIKEFTHLKGNQFEPLGSDHFIGHMLVMEDGGKRFHTVNIYDSNFKEKKRIWQEESMAPSQKQKGWYLFFKSFCHSVVLNDRVFVVGRDDFVIDVFDLSGNKVQSIRQELEKVKFTNQHKEKILELYRTRPSTKHEYEEWKRLLNFPEYFPPIRNIFTGGKRLYVRTYREIDGKSEFLIFDQKGVLLKKTYLQLAPSATKFAFPYMRDSSPFVFRDGKLYQLVGIEDELNEKVEWQLQVSKIE